MAISRKLRVLLLIAAGLSLFQGCPRSSAVPTILFVHRDQSDTSSLNPSRLAIAAELALKKSLALYGKADRVRHHFITYAGEEKNGAEAALAYLATDPSVVAVVGDISSPGSRLLAELADKKNLVHLSFFATDDSIFQNKPWSFSYRSTLAQEHAVVREIIQERLKAGRLALFSTSNQTITPRINHIKAFLPAQGVQVVFESNHQGGDRDFLPAIERLKRTDADAVLVMLSASQTDYLLQQLQLAGLRLPVILSIPSISVEAFKDTAPIGLELYTLVPSAYLALSEGADPDFLAFRTQYQIAMGNNRFDTGGLWSYDGILLLHELLQRTESADQLRKALAGYSGDRLVGRVRFNDSGVLADANFQAVRLRGGLYEVLPR